MDKTQQKPLFWYRPCSDGAYEGPIHDSSIEEVRKQSGAWKPLFDHSGDATDMAAEIERLRPLADEVHAARHVMREHNRLLVELAASQEELRATKEVEFPRKVEAVVRKVETKWQAELAASQAREEQLREALDVAGRNMDTAHEYDRERDDLSCAVFSGGECDCHVGVVNEALRALALPKDTSALEAIVARAGEVMRERCSLSVLLEHGGPEDECRPALEECSEAIRALPGVKLEDLQK